MALCREPSRVLLPEVETNLARLIAAGEKSGTDRRPRPAAHWPERALPGRDSLPQELSPTLPSAFDWRRPGRRSAALHPRVRELCRFPTAAIPQLCRPALALKPRAIQLAAWNQIPGRVQDCH